MAKVTAEAAEALSRENGFLSGVRANIEGLKGSYLRGSVWETGAEDDSDSLRAMMASKRMYDRDMLAQMPHNRRVTVKGFERSWFFWRKQTGVAIASVISPLDELLDGSDAEPIGINQLTEHLRKIAGDARVPYIVGVCSTSGFTQEVRDARHEYPNVQLVLVEPASGGGWRVTADESVPVFLKEMFDPEDVEQKTKRVWHEVQSQSADLLTGSISAVRLAGQLNLPRSVVDQALAKLADDDPELHVSRQAGDCLLYRGASSRPKEKSSMSFVDKIKEMFSRDGDEVNKITVLSEKRAALAQRRDRMYEEIGKLEEKEAQLIAQGRENKSAVVRRRLAAQVAQLRKDIARQNTTANMLNQQLNIISTDIHNLTLIEQGEVASLPSTEELTENAVKAEEMLETLKGDADLVSSLETGLGEVLTSDEERDILAEFEEPEAAPSNAGRSPEVSERLQPAEDDPPAVADEDTLEKGSRRDPAGPEAS